MKTFKSLSELLICLIPAILAIWVFWFPLRQWAFNLIPENMELLKIVVVFLIGWFGGIAIPIILVVLGLMIWARINNI